jgi:hypothetical protein
VNLQHLYAETPLDRLTSIYERELRDFRKCPTFTGSILLSELEKELASRGMKRNYQFIPARWWEIWKVDQEIVTWEKGA